MGKEGDLTLLIPFLDAKHKKGVRSAAASAIRERFLELESLPKRHAAEAPLIRMLDDANIRARSTAIHTLAKIGNEPSEAALRAFAANNQVNDPDLTSVALDAAAAIRIRLASPDKRLPTENADMKRLEEKIKALEDRLERMERWR